METLKNKIMIGVFLIFIFGLSISNLVAKDREFSETENRNLQQLPQFSVDSLVSGRYTSDFDKYMTDQFIAKDRWVGLKSDVERVLLQKGENNGIFFGKDGYLLEKLTSEGPYYERNIEAINTFAKKLPDLDSTVILAPTAVGIYPEKLPLFAPTINQELLLEEASLQLITEFVDAYQVLNAHKNEYIYYKTDHHWTTLGAYYIYQQLMNQWGMTPYLNYETKEITTAFYGTHYSKANNTHLSSDSITLYYPKDEVKFSVTFGSETEVLDGLYNYDYLNKKDKYSMFLNGNHPLTVVKSSINNGQKLVIFKDSYSHCLVPFLAMNFEEIHLIDLRYFNSNPYEYIQQQQFDRALFVYNLSTFGTDATIIKLKTNQ